MLELRSMISQKMCCPSVFFAIPLVLAIAACGDDESETPDIDAAPSIDARLGSIDAAAGVVCPNALAIYPGMLFSPSATDSGQLFQFEAQLTSDNPPDGLRLSIDGAVVEKLGNFALPSPDWQASICVDNADGSCTNELKVVSGTLIVTSVSGRFQATLNESVYADDLDTPTCSAALRQASFDVTILVTN